MITKIGIILLALLAGWFLVLKPMLGGGRSPVPRPQKTGRKAGSETALLEPCPRCGTYRAAGDPCGCDAGSHGKR